MWQKLIQTDRGWDALAVRLALGVMIFPHGAQKALGWFGGYGFGGTMQFFTEHLGIPTVFALFAILAEFLGGIALIAGFGTRLAAISVGATLLVAAGMMHLDHGFFMNWSGQQSGEGVEFFLLATGLAVAAALRGAGNFSFDLWLSERS
ncbi:MAG: DoxX family protein [Acidobacteria bacterium]|nr:DoxX family protein [Acidobacteriota bacterium]